MSEEISLFQDELSSGYNHCSDQVKCSWPPKTMVNKGRKKSRPAEEDESTIGMLLHFPTIGLDKILKQYNNMGNSTYFVALSRLAIEFACDNNK